MSDLMISIKSMLDVFTRYASRDGDPNSLSKPELKELLEKELTGFLDPKDPSQVDQVLKGLDQDKSGTVDFQEYVTMVAVLACMCRDFKPSSKGAAQKKC
ncbi:protein S100-A1 [Amia ocellicauda]|uniref:protein S100-A1 n=1 Tax=Amia ocellicauda TaxID=2972642 RepID=UPI0034643831|nr:S10A1 protein [Amia calva]